MRTSNLFTGSFQARSFMPQQKRTHLDQAVTAACNHFLEEERKEEEGAVKVMATDFICPVTSHSSKDPGECYQRQHNTWQQEDGHLSLLTVLLGCDDQAPHANMGRIDYFQKKHSY